jgi:peroxin-12
VSIQGNPSVVLYQVILTCTHTELLSEQQLNALIPPSLRYLLALATHRVPRPRLRRLNSVGELYALLSLLIERHYLVTHAGSFTENFYNLKRERVLCIKGGELPRTAQASSDQVRETLKLRPTTDIWKNLAVLVALPYIKRKLDEHYDIHAASANLLQAPFLRNASLPENPTYKQRFLHAYKWALRNIYPSVNAAYYFAILAFNLAYLFDASKYHNPFFWLIGTRIRRMNSADHKAIAASSSSSSQKQTGAPPSTRQSLFSPRTLTQVVYPRLLSSLKILLPTSIFALKFLEWWHASDFARQLSRKAAEGLELPTPTITGIPQVDMAKKKKQARIEKSGVTFASAMKEQVEKGEEGKREEKEQEQEKKKAPPISSTTNAPILTVVSPCSSNNNKKNNGQNCPICKSEIKTPTAAQTGYVYCYTCIFRWTKGQHDVQVAFMRDKRNCSLSTTGKEDGEQEDGERDDDDDDDDEDEEGEGKKEKWEDGRGRCAVTGRRLLGGTGGLRRVMV